MKRTAVITGATGTIGSAITKLMIDKGYHVVMITRDKNKTEGLLNKLNSGHTNYLLTDLSSNESIESACRQIDGPVEVLINNAAITPRSRKENQDGIEMQWAVNVLGYYRMIKALLPNLAKGENPRIVNVASYWAGGLDLNDPEFKKRDYDNDTAYRQSKQADRMLSKAMAVELKSKGISINACHPGDANSNLSNSLGFGGHESPEQAASTPVWLASEDVGYKNTGKYFERKSESDCRFSQNQEQVKRFYELVKSY